jgi:hypothetical protein
MGQLLERVTPLLLIDPTQKYGLLDDASWLQLLDAAEEYGLKLAVEDVHDESLMTEP